MGTVAGQVSPALETQNGPCGQIPIPGRGFTRGSGSVAGTQAVPCAAGVPVGVDVVGAWTVVVVVTGVVVVVTGAVSTLTEGAGLAAGSLPRQPAVAAVIPSTAR
jgi:hypothetical protein